MIPPTGVGSIVWYVSGVTSAQDRVVAATNPQVSAIMRA